METRILKYFLTIAKVGTVSAAARELHVAQPTLSRQIQQLESELGTPLFIRERHRMVLTKAGLAYQLHVQQILLELERANQLVRNINNDELTGTIDIGCVESAVTRFLTPKISQFHQENPNVIFNIYDAFGTAIKERLDQGLLEVGFVSTPIDTAKYHYLKLPIQDLWGVVVNENSHLFQQSTVSMEDLKDIPVIIPHRQLVRDDLSDWLQKSGVSLNVVAEYNLLTNVIYLAKADLGTLICIKGVELPADSHLKFIPFEPQHLLNHFLIWRKGTALSEPAQALINFIKGQLSVQ